jgi:hypothetical protein
MGACQSSDAIQLPQQSSKSLRSATSVGPTPSVLSGREKFDDVAAKFVFEKVINYFFISLIF